MARSKVYGPSLKMRYSGPFFEHDPAKTFRENGRDYIIAVMTDAADTAENMAPRVSGDYARAIAKARAKSLTGRRWIATSVLTTYGLHHDWGVAFSRRGYAAAGRTRVYRPGTGKFNYAGKVERRHHVFRRAKSTVYRARHVAKERQMLRGLD